MKRLIIVAALFGATAIMPASAKDKVTKQTPDQLCAMEGVWASIIMGFRQLGTPPSDLIYKNPDRRAMILLAYEYPRYETKEARDRSGQDFQIEIEKMCFKAIQDRETTQ